MNHRNVLSKRLTLPYLGFVLVFATVALAAEVPRISKEELRSMLGNPDTVIIDVRLSGHLSGSDTKIQGAIREDPEKVNSWIEKYPKDKTLVFYCA